MFFLSASFRSRRVAEGFFFAEAEAGERCRRKCSRKRDGCPPSSCAWGCREERPIMLIVCLGGKGGGGELDESVPSIYFARESCNGLHQSTVLFFLTTNYRISVRKSLPYEGSKKRISETSVS